MIELVFVIVVLGILAAIAIPKFSASRTDAIIAKGRSEVAAIRSGIINERQSRIIKGQTNFISASDLSTGNELFNGVLTYGFKAGTKGGSWSKGSSGTYSYHINGSTSVDFTYDASKGTFTCDRSKTYCQKLVD